MNSLIIKILGKKNFQELYAKFLHFLLRIQGYDNYQNFKISGEEYFIQSLKSLNISVCIDIGAHVGNYTNLVLFNTNAQILAFEPQKYAFSRLQTLARSNSNRIYAFEIALSNTSGKLDLLHNDGFSQLATLEPRLNSIDWFAKLNMEKSQVNVSTLDEFLANNPKLVQKVDLIKIDVEGMEFEVLCGAQQTIENLRPKIIQIEFSEYLLYKGLSLIKFHEKLSNYRVFQILPFRNGLIERNPKDSLVNIFKFANFVFVRKDVCPLLLEKIRL